ncbi:MAG: 2-succinyl-5-enolpyruvyl-6-hydroxy-3-cyclohexene-1-carboxylic-acid synthase [Acidimicrobiia bacterium]|nr:2-succinyl-5-enolpyruvyl-6-hydroxy-3-cyclohexene-1-carboxylic-acid synthase [Acidimicrobiia bacterium]
MTDPSSASSGLVAAMVDEWVRAGVTHAFVSPGSRSTPLALAVAQRMNVEVVLDERSAAFHALGYGKVTGRPAVLVCTSGTAAANYYPAVKEADLSSVPMIVCTADRPPELRDTGAPQAMDQQQLYGSAVRWFVDPGVPADHPGAGSFWRSLGARTVAEAAGADPGPVHLNLPFREPFLTDAEPADYPGRADGAPWTRFSDSGSLRADPADTTAFVERINATERGLLLLGQDPAIDFATVARFEAATGWPVLADPLSGMRTVDSITTYDALARCEDWIAAHRPEMVVRLGRPLTSKAVGLWLESDVHQVIVSPRRTFVDPHRTAAVSIVAEPRWLLGNAAENVHRGAHDWMAEWMVAEGRARSAIDTTLDAAAVLTEPRIARDVAAAAPEGTRILLGSSMPVRDVESFAAGRHGVDFMSNRGANGIDGMVSTAMGMAIGSTRPTIALIGDIGFLHDTNGLLMAADRGVDVTLVVVDNDGGGIFSFLPQAGHTRFEQLFGTPHGADIPAIAAAHGVPVVAPTEPDVVATAVEESVAAGGVRLIHLRTDRHANVDVHQQIWNAVREAVE